VSACQCCGHAVSGDQHGLCACCERTLPGIGLLPDDILPHVLIRAAGGSMKDAAKATGTRPYDSDYALTKAQKALGCRRDYLLTVARYGQATHRLNVPAGFERPAHETPQHQAPKPKTLERVVIETPPPQPVVTEWREPEPREPVRMLTDRAEVAPLPRAVEAINQEEEEMTTDIDPAQQAKITERLEQTLAPAPTAAAQHLLTEARKAANDAGMDYQCAFAELAHLALTGEGLPDMNLVHLAYKLGVAKGRVEALEALA
jgi:hypothetical protein